MKKSNLLMFFFLAALVAVASCKKDDDDLDCSTVKFSTDIAPLIASKCATAGCHDATTGMVIGDYTSYSGLEDRAKNGDMEAAVITNKSMPKTGSLSQSELDKFQCWFDAGAPNN